MTASTIAPRPVRLQQSMHAAQRALRRAWQATTPLHWRWTLGLALFYACSGTLLVLMVIGRIDVSLALLIENLMCEVPTAIVALLGVMHVETIDEAIALTNSHLYGNQASLFTSSGAAARKFRYEAEAGNVGINIGVAAPMAFFPFSGWKDSFFGDLHGQGMDAVEFFTQKKVVVERWPKEWSRKF